MSAEAYVLLKSIVEENFVGKLEIGQRSRRLSNDGVFCFGARRADEIWRAKQRRDSKWDFSRLFL